ncbi:hypothetical protein PF008_g21632 [Phytophthora fragariae]|uniref:Uncharacterized protein n=1 Tax=Phytophthora fragariae TaxID=53985 RepID=A0A6G0QWA1_9STRA|nr:hypothetical protein PF008_g21632 [Phytophthora fragariae]
MKSGKFTNAVVSIESAWICAAEVDVQREEEERVEALGKLRKQSVKDKYELASATNRLDQELKEQQLQWKKKTEMRRLRQLPTDERELAAKAAEASSNNNRKKGSIYAMENLRLAMLMKDTKLRQRVKKKKIRPRIVQDMLTLERRYAEGARRLQKWWRGYLHRQFWRLYFRQVKAAVQIQRFEGSAFREWCHSDSTETRNRQEFMAVLEAEEEWHRVQRDKLQARLNRKQLQERVAQLEYDYFMQHEHIHDMESIYLDMQTQRMRVSPRAIEHGWVEEMEAKMKQQRALITKLKLDTVFGLGLEFKLKEKELVEFQQRIYELEQKRRRFEIWRNEEFLDYWERECRFRYQEKLIQRRQQIAETRRRWQIQFYRSNGKRDNRWRGTYWSQDVLDAAKEKEVFCIGSTDILALVQDKWRLRMQEIESSGQVLDDEIKERDTREHIKDLTDQVALTAATAQIEQTKALFDPVFREVERSFNKVQKQQRAHEKRLRVTRQERQIHEAVDNGVAEQEDRMLEPHGQHAEDPVHELDHQQRKRQLILAAKVPWHLLDQLEAERRKLAREKAMFKLWGKNYSDE